MGFFLLKFPSECTAFNGKKSPKYAKMIHALAAEGVYKN